MKTHILTALCTAALLSAAPAWADNGDMLGDKGTEMQNRVIYDDNLNYNYPFRNDMFPKRATYQPPSEDMVGEPTTPKRNYNNSQVTAPSPNLPSEYR